MGPSISGLIIAKPHPENLQFNMFQFFSRIAFAVVLCSVFSCARTPVYPEVRPQGGAVRIALRDLPEKTAVFKTYYDRERGINYFVLKVNDKAESYFDACAKCYPKRLGYRIEGGRLGCRACDVKYSPENLKEGLGTCYPIRLPGKVEGEFYIISEADLKAGGKYF